MPRLRSKKTGVVVTVSDELASLLSHRFVPVEDEVKPRRSTRKKPADDDE